MTNTVRARVFGVCSALFFAASYAMAIDAPVVSGLLIAASFSLLSGTLWDIRKK